MRPQAIANPEPQHHIGQSRQDRSNDKVIQQDPQHLESVGIYAQAHYRLRSLISATFWPPERSISQIHARHAVSDVLPLGSALTTLRLTRELILGRRGVRSYPLLMTLVPAGSALIRPSHWAVASFAVVLLAVDVLGAFLAYFVFVPAVATCLTAVVLGVRGRGRARAIMATTVVIALIAAGISAYFIWVGSLNVG